MPFSRQNVQPIEGTKLGVVDRVRPEHVHACGARESDVMLARYQEYVRQELDAQQCFWLCMYRGEYGRERWQNEKLDGWKIVAFATPAGGDRDFWKAHADVYLETIRERGPDPLAAHALAHAGASRVHSMADLRKGSGAGDEWIDEHLARQDVGERIVGVYNLSPETESYLLVGREPGETAFTQDDASKLFDLLVDFPRVHYWLALERGLVAPAERPFSPRERDVVRALLGPESEQEIADRLGLSRGTTHNYVVEIFRCLGVRSRHELVQLWLSGLAVGGGGG